MRYSHSAVETFESCKFKYKMRYLDKVKTIPPTDPDNALILGQALHTGLEKGLEAAIEEYCDSFPVITDDHINEIIKLKYIIPIAQKAIPPGGQYEVELLDKDFNGYIDYLVPTGERNEYDIYDFKYSNHTDHYKRSRQLHLYKYFFERDNPGRTIRNLYFLMIPKVQIRKKKSESLSDFRRRIDRELENAGKPKLIKIEFSYEKVIEFLFEIKAMKETEEFLKASNRHGNCSFCEFYDFCTKGWEYMKLPKNERRNIDEVTRRTLWIYGVPFCGKTTFANSFPDPLMLNTDGNIKFVDAPYIRIKDEVTVEGRQTKRKFAWEVFKEAIAELERKDNTFRTIVVDLLEDTYEACRVYMCNQMGISHESDDSFKAWDKVRGEFLNTLRRLMNLDYENIILISHEDASRDITKKSGDKITAIKPNLSEKVANKVAGMVDVVGRVMADGDNRVFSFKSNEVIFGGGRLTIRNKEIPLDVNALFAAYDEANANAQNKAKKAAEAPARTRRKAAQSVQPTTHSNPTPEPENAPDGPQGEAVGGVLTEEEDKCFYIPETDNYVRKHSGDAAPDGGIEISEEDFNAGLKRIAQEPMNRPEEVPFDKNAPAPAVTEADVTPPRRKGRKVRN